MASEHHLDLHDRNREGGRHHFRWFPRCTCGEWVGIPRAKAARARRDYNDHVNERRKASAPNRGGKPGPKILTPRDQLPEALR